MARIRYLKPDFFRDEDLAELPHWIRLLYAGLWSIADKEGRLEDRPKRIKIDIFPYDKVDIAEGLDKLVATKSSGRPYIQRYEVEGECYIQIIKWHDHQKPHHTERDSIIPPAPPYIYNQELDSTKDKDKENGECSQRKLEVSNGEVTVKRPLPTVINEDFLTTLKNNKAYKHINIDRELAKMDAWLLTRKGREKTRRFIVNWLNKIDPPIETFKKKEAPYRPLERPDPAERAKVADLIKKTAKEIK